jgi:hypothetical protein
MQTHSAVQAWLSKLPVVDSLAAASSGIGLRSPVPAPAVKDPLTSVRVLRAIFVGGKACEIGSEARLSLSDAQALQNSTPPTVKII